MSTIADHSTLSTTSAYEASKKHPLAKTPAFIAVMAVMAVLAATGVAMASPVVTALAGLCTVTAAFGAAFSMTYESA